jgi:branched-chain amino acid transport system substrate-binding protein
MTTDGFPRADPVRIGSLFDFPQRDGGVAFDVALRLGLDEAAAVEGFDRDIEIVQEHVKGLPLGSEHDVVAGVRALDDAGVLAFSGPAVSDNGYIVAPLVDEVGISSINYTGGERTRSHFGFHYQIGSLEEEPPILAQRLAARGLTRAAVVFEHSPVGRRYAEVFDRAHAGAGVDVTGTAAITSLDPDVTPALERLRRTEPDALVYLGLGYTSHAVATALAAVDWDVPVVANSSLMFGYMRPDWRDAWRGWEYLDGVADDNELRRALAARAPEVAASPVLCGAYDMGRLLGTAIARADHLTRDGVRESLERVKQLPATSGYEGTTMGFGVYDHAALKGRYLVLREWRDGETVQVERAATK